MFIMLTRKHNNASGVFFIILLMLILGISFKNIYSSFLFNCIHSGPGVPCVTDCKNSACYGDGKQKTRCGQEHEGESDAFQPLVNDVLVLGHWDLRSSYVLIFLHDFLRNGHPKITVHIDPVKKEAKKKNQASKKSRSMLQNVSLNTMQPNRREQQN